MDFNEKHKDLISGTKRGSVDLLTGLTTSLFGQLAFDAPQIF